MAYDSTYRKIYTSENPDVGVSIADVQKALGVSNTDLGNLCKHTKVNMWAKWKPIHAPYLGLMTTSIMQTLYQQGVYPYGIKKGEAGVTLWNMSTGEINHNEWQYTKPTGTSASPYRLVDFACWDDHTKNGYYHLAPCPIETSFPSELDIPDDNTSDSISFILKFQSGVSGWQIDDTCLSITDLLGNVDYYLTVGLLHWDSIHGMQQYLKSTEQKLGVISQTTNAAVILVDPIEFRSIIGSNYLTNGQEWTAIMFLSGHKYVGDNNDHTLNVGDSIYMLECTRDADRQTLNVVRSSWSDHYFDSMELTTYLTKDGESGYRLYKYGGYGLSFTLTRNDTKREEANFNVSLQLECILGSVGNYGRHVEISTIGTIAFAENDSQKTFNYESLTGYNFKFEEQQNIKRAIITVRIERIGDIPSDYNLSTSTDCSGGNNTYETTISKSNV